MKAKGRIQAKRLADGYLIEFELETFAEGGAPGPRVVVRQKGPTRHDAAVKAAQAVASLFPGGSAASLAVPHVARLASRLPDALRAVKAGKVTSLAPVLAKWATALTG